MKSAMQRNALASLLMAAALVSQGASGATLQIASMDVVGGAMRAPALHLEAALIHVGPATNLVGGYVGSGGEGYDEFGFSPDSILAFNFGGLGLAASFYTAAANLGDQDLAAGVIQGGMVPSGTVDPVTGSITLDLSSLFMNMLDTDVNVAPFGGGLAYGGWNALTQAYHLQWEAYVPGGGGFGSSWEFELTGFAAPVPEPSTQALWLATFGIFVIARAAKGGKRGGSTHK